MLQREPYRSPKLVANYKFDEPVMVSDRTAHHSDLYALGCVLLQAVTGVSHKRVPSEARQLQRSREKDEFTVFVQSLLAE